MKSRVAEVQELGGKYRIVAELGQGGTARVWLAVARGPHGFSKLVVLKTMKPELASEAELTQMFSNEARLAARLNHPNIVQTNEVFDHEGLPIIVMEYLDGQPLSQILARDRAAPGFSLPHKLRTLSEVLGGLEAAHVLTDFDGRPLGVVHRDVSPHNVIVTYDGNVKVIDFGIAKLGALGETTESGVIKGKLHYIAPEQIAGSPIDRRADVYSAGIMLWEMVTRSRLWRGVNEAVVMNRILSGNLPRLAERAPDVDPYLQELVDRATARDPSDRYRSAADFQLDIDEYVASLSGHVRARDVGSEVARLFADKRKELKQLLDEEISRVLSMSEQEYLAAEFARLPQLEALAERAEATRKVARKERFGRLATALGLLLLAAIGALLVTRTFTLPSPVELPAPSGRGPVVRSRADEPRPSPPPKENVLLRLSAQPAETRFELDGVPLVGNPHLGSYPMEPGTTRTLVASASGYTPITRAVVLGEDQELFLALAPLPTAPPATSRPTTKKRPSAPASTTPPAATTPLDCDPPFYVDDRGVKRYKPGCL